MSSEMLFPSIARSGAFYAGWLLLAVALGSITKSFKEFTLGAVAVFAAFPLQMLLPLSGLLTWLEVHGLAWWTFAAGTVIALGTVYALYRYRDVRRYAWLPVAVSFALGVLGIRSRPSDPLTAWDPARAQRPSALADSSHALRLSIDSVGSTASGVRLLLKAQPVAGNFDGRVRFTNLITQLEDSNGHRRTIDRGTDVRDAPLLLMSGSRSQSSGESTSTELIVASVGTPWMSRTVTIAAADWDAVRAGTASIRVRAMVEELATDSSFSLPLRGMRPLTAGARRMRVEKVYVDSSGLRLSVTLPVLGVSRLDGSLLHEGTRSYALVNDSLMQRVALRLVGTGHSNEMMVLPGETIGRVADHLALSANDAIIRQVSAAEWRINARVVVDQWKVARRYAVDLRVTR